MKKGYLFILILIISFGLVMSFSQPVHAIGDVNMDGGPLKDAELLSNPAAGPLNEDHSGVDTWITKWYGPDKNYASNGGFGVSAPMDLIDLSSGGKLNQVDLSTIKGLMKTKNTDLNWGDANGGATGWEVFEINPFDALNMQKDGGPIDNFDSYWICVIEAKKDIKAVMSPTHDDHAQIWINGEKWYNNSTWTGAVQQVDYNIEVQLEKGANVVLFRCGEGGGHAYMNLHFDDDTDNAVKYYPNKANDQTSFFQEVAGALPVEPEDKLTTIWADIKRK